MRPEIKAYLDLSRGSKNYKLSTDEVAESLASNYRSTLNKYNIEVVVIWSKLAKNELISCNNGIYTIIWDTNYWLHFAYYCNNMQSLEQHIKHGSPYSELQCDALWRDLFRIAFFRVNKNSLKYQLQFTKYYLSYGMRSFPYRDSEKEEARHAYESMVNIANAKMYAFLHEMAHLTAKPCMEYYATILKNMFNSELQKSTYSSVTDTDAYLEQSERDMLHAHLDEMRDELNAGDLTNFQEIIADMRAIHSMCTTFILNASECAPEDFLQLKDGIILQRSFNLRIRNIEACLRELSNASDLSVFRRKLMNSQFGKYFVIRDKLSEVTELFILRDSFGRLMGSEVLDFLDKYTSKPVYSRKTAEVIDQAIDDHLRKVYDRIQSENISFNATIGDVSDIMDYLLYYSNEDHDQLIVNQPKSSFGWTGLFFDGVDDVVENHQNDDTQE